MAAFISDRQAKMACKRASVSANGLLVIICGQCTIALDDDSPLPLTFAAQRRDRSLLAWKNIDRTSKSCLDGAHENENDWINSGVLLSGSYSMPCRRPADGHLEAERIEIEDHTWHVEKHTGCLLKHVWPGENQGRWYRCEW